MNNKFTKNYFRTLFFIIISFLYLTLFENDICGSVNNTYASDLINIEAIFQPDLPEEFQSYKDSSPLKQRKEYEPFYLENIVKCRKKLLLSVNSISNIYFNSQNKYSLPFHHIISILQKNNTWHQSFDDDASHNDYC